MFMMTISVGLYHCNDRSLIMPEYDQKIEYSMNIDFKDYFLGDLYFIDEMNGWITCMIGQGFLKTSDGGKSWKYIILDSKSGYTDISFKNNREGWMIRSPRGEHIFILHTEDAGESWNELYSFQDKGLVPSSVSIDFVNNSIGWITIIDNSSTLEIFQTINGGRDWILQKSNSTTSCVSFNNFVSENTGWISTNRDIYKTLDGGNHWINQKQNIPRISDSPWPSYGKIDFIDENTGFILLQDFDLFRTDNGGEAWYRIFSDLSSSRSNSQNRCCYDFFDNQSGAVARDSLYVTKDGGLNWDFIYGCNPDDDDYISNVYFASKNSLYAIVRNHTILKFIIH